MAETIPCRSVLKDRSADVRRYIDFLSLAVENGARIATRSASSLLSKDLTHTLKANTYLLLYNAVESTMTQAIVDIHDSIESEPTNIDKMNQSLLAWVLRRFRNGKIDFEDPSSSSAGNIIIDYWLRDHKKLSKDNKNPLFSGNIDARRIIDVGKKYGFIHSANEPTFQVESLQTTKNKRNDLAHGGVSFIDCGRDIDVPSLTREAESLLACLEEVVSAVETYIAGKGWYVTQSPPPPAQPPQHDQA